MQQDQKLVVENTYKHILSMALPVSIAIVIPQISMFINTLFLGYYHPTHTTLSSSDMLAASGIAGIYHLTMVMFGYGLVSGMLMLMSRKAGEENPSGLMHIFNNGILLCAGFASLLLIVSFWLAPFLFSNYIHHPGIQEAAISFIQIRKWALPVFILCQLTNAFFIATGQSKNIIWGSFAQAASNVIFDYIFIFGHFGINEMGLNGAALASVFSEIVFLSVSVIVFWKRNRLVFSKIKNYDFVDFSVMKSILYKSSPLMIQFLLSIGAWEVFFIFVEHLGEKESAISQILRSVFGIVGVAAWALASVCNSMVSNLIGQKREQEVLATVNKIVWVSFLFAFMVGLPLLIFPKYFLGLMTQNENLVMVGSSSLQIVVLATWMLSISTIYFNAVVGSGNTKMNMLFEFAAILLYLLYCTLVIEYKRWPLPWAWGSEFVYWLSLFLMSALYLRYRFNPNNQIPNRKIINDLPDIG